MAPNIENPRIPCCPDLEKDDVCDVLDFHYRQTHSTSVVSSNRRVLVEVLIHARFERCPGPMTRAGALSGGNLQKALLARELAFDPKVLVVSQPTRGLDVGSGELVDERCRCCCPGAVNGHRDQVGRQ